MANSLCNQGLDWDHVPSNEIRMGWKQLEEEVVVISTIFIPRWIDYTEGHNIDISKAACGAVIYIY